MQLDASRHLFFLLSYRLDASRHFLANFLVTLDYIYILTSTDCLGAEGFALDPSIVYELSPNFSFFSRNKYLKLGSVSPMHSAKKSLGTF